MATQKAYGTLFEYLTAPSTWTALARVKSIKPFVIKSKDIDTTVLDSADEFEESLPGLADGGEVELELEYDDTQCTTLDGFFRTVKSYRIHYPNNKGWTFSGYVSELGDDTIENGKIISSKYKVKVTGKPARASIS